MHQPPNGSQLEAFRETLEVDKYYKVDNDKYALSLASEMTHADLSKLYLRSAGGRDTTALNEGIAQAGAALYS
jgi:hypothetical protein